MCGSPSFIISPLIVSHSSTPFPLLFSDRFVLPYTFIRPQYARLWLVPNGSAKTCHLSFADVIPEENQEIGDLVMRANKKLQSRSFKGG